MSTKFSCYKIDNEEDFGFSPSDYSRFKFGDEKIAEKFGTQLADTFCKNVLEHAPIANQIVVISSPHAFIPTATFAMKNYFVYALNKWLIARQYPVVQEAKIHRTITYKEDYGALSAEERHTLICNDVFHIDKSFLESKTLLFLDDIKITGSHERMILKMIETHSLQNDVYMLYFAELINNNIHPSIENYLNYFEIKTIFDLETIVNTGFAINTRVVKFMLSADANSFKIFMENKNADLINLVYNMAIGNSYHTIPEYQPNLALLNDIINSYNSVENIY